MKKILIFVILLMLVFTSTVNAQTTTIDIDLAKELALENARIIKISQQDLNRLKILMDQAEDIYNKEDPYKNWGYAVNYIMILEQEITELANLLSNPELSPEERVEIEALILSKQVSKAKQEELALFYKSQIPKYPGMDSAVKNNWDSATNEYNNSKIGHEQMLKQFELSIEKMYINLLEVEETIEIQNKIIELNHINQKITSLKSNLGLGTQADEESIKANLSKAEKSLNEYNNYYKAMKYKLKDFMGIDSKNDIQLERLNYIPVRHNFTFESLAESFFKNSKIISQMERELADLEKDLGCINDNSNERALISTSIELSKLNIDETQQRIREQILASLNTANTRYNEWQAASSLKNQKNKISEVDKMKYELGLISKIQYLASEVEYYQSIANEHKDAYAYYLAYRELELINEGIIELNTSDN